MDDKVIESLLRQVDTEVRVIAEARKRFSAQLAPEFSIFKYLKDNENGLSECICDLLNPKQSHGQGQKYLDLFIDILKRKEPGLKLDGWVRDEPKRVLTENSTHHIANSQRRIDIYIEWPNGVIGIENKPWARDQENQLNDYAEHLKKTADNWLLIYLCNGDPSDWSIPESEREILTQSGNYLRIDFEDIVDWLKHCACSTKPLAVRVFIEELAKFIMEKVMGENMFEEENAVCNIILKDDNFSAAFHISRSINDAKTQILNTFYSALSKKIGEIGLLIENNRFIEQVKFSSICIRKNEVQTKCLCFEFFYPALNDFYWCIKNFSKEPSCPAITDAMDDSKRFKEKGRVQDPEYPWWHYPGEDDYFSDEFKNWESSLAPWEAMQNEELVKTIVAIAKAVYDDDTGVFNNANIHLLN